MLYSTTFQDTNTNDDNAALAEPMQVSFDQIGT